MPKTIKVGDPVILGNLPGVAQESFDKQTGGAIFYVLGAFYLKVEEAQERIRTVYATGILDEATGITHTLKLSIHQDAGCVEFGQLELSNGKMSVVRLK